jgi:hypothetical protein
MTIRQGKRKSSSIDKLLNLLIVIYKTKSKIWKFGNHQNLPERNTHYKDCRKVISTKIKVESPNYHAVSIVCKKMFIIIVKITQFINSLRKIVRFTISTNIVTPKQKYQTKK